MAHHSRVTSSFQHIDPILAQQWLAHHNFARQRRVRPHHVAALAQAMRQGTFREGTPISFAVVQGERYLINGQHTLHAIVRSGRALWLTIEEHHCKDSFEVAALYKTFDTQLRRTGSDLFAASDFAGTHDLSTNMVDALSGAISIIIGGFVSGTRGKDHPCNLFISNPHNKEAAMAMWAEPARAYFQTFSQDTPGFVKWQAHRAMVAAVGIVTFRYQPVAAKEFWERIARREMLTSSMPEYRLINYLAPPQESGMRMGFLYSRGVAAAWNAAFRGKTLNRGIVPRRLDLPMLIAGTPFDGQRTLMYFRANPDGLGGQLSWTPIEIQTEKPCTVAGNMLHS